ncbi:MAG TPA: glyoxylate carboligase [Conexibacter sp.]|nr:glyoxylate carboligase [Conexibacter sp.]
MKVDPMEAVVRVLEDEGVECIWGIPGAAILPLYKALSRSPIRHLSVRHEEGGTHAADGYARVTGRVGVTVGTSGPAGTNMITGLYTALADSIPIICITGQAPKHVLHREAFQAVDIVEIAKPVCKWAVQVKEPGQLPWAFREAFRIAQEGRPGPVLIDLPLDVQRGAPIEYDEALDERLPIPAVEPNPLAIARVLELLDAAERPLLLPGGGVIIADAAPELVTLAERLGVPVSPTLMGKGVIPEDHPLYAGMVGIQTSQPHANQVFLESDFVLAIGARFADRHTGELSVYRGERTFVHIDIDPRQLGRVFAPELGVVSDAALALRELLRQTEERAAEEPDARRRAWTARLDELRASMRRPTDFDQVPIMPPRVFQELNELLEPNDTVVTAIGLYQIWSGQFQETFKPRHYLCCGQAGPLGWELPACIGAKLGRPDSRVVAVVGDYSFGFLMEEIAVAVQYSVPFVVVMLNNAYMSLIRQNEVNVYDMNYAVDIGYEGPNEANGIDHVLAMESMGGIGRRVERPEEIAEAYRWAAEESERLGVPALVEIVVDRDANASMGGAIDAVKEFIPGFDPADHAGAMPAIAG